MAIGCTVDGCVHMPQAEYELSLMFMILCLYYITDAQPSPLCDVNPSLRLSSCIDGAYMKQMRLPSTG